MSAAKHTPGPWFAADNSWDFSTVYGPGGKAVALCQISEDVTEETQSHFESINEANARLIAAAPDLLEALKEIVGFWDSIAMTDCVNDLHVKARAAIAKAEGGAA